MPERACWTSSPAKELSFPDESFDQVLCGFGIKFFPGQDRGLAQMRRVLAAFVERVKPHQRDEGLYLGATALLGIASK